MVKAVGIMLIAVGGIVMAICVRVISIGVMVMDFRGIIKRKSWRQL